MALCQQILCTLLLQFASSASPHPCTVFSIGTHIMCFMTLGCEHALQKGQRQELVCEREGWGVQVSSDLMNALLEKSGNKEKL